MSAEQGSREVGEAGFLNCTSGFFLVSLRFLLGSSCKNLFLTQLVLVLIAATLKFCAGAYLQKHAHVCFLVFWRYLSRAWQEKSFVSAKLCGAPILNFVQSQNLGAKISWGRRTPKTVGNGRKHVHFLVIWH